MQQTEHPTACPFPSPDPADDDQCLADDDEQYIGGVNHKDKIGEDSPQGHISHQRELDTARS